MEINGFLIGLYGYGLFMANVKYFLACSVLNYFLNIQKSGYPRSPHTFVYFWGPPADFN